MEKSILEQISKVNPSSITPDSATELIYSFYKMVDEHPLLATISQEDITLISQRLPEESILKHLEEDRNMSAKLMRFLQKNSRKASTFQGGGCKAEKMNTSIVINRYKCYNKSWTDR